MTRSFAVTCFVLVLQLMATGCATQLRESPWVVVKSNRFEKGFDLVPSAPDILACFAECNLAKVDEASARLFLNRMLAVKGEDRQHNAIDKALSEMRKRRTEAAEKVGLTTTASSAPESSHASGPDV